VVEIVSPAVDQDRKGRLLRQPVQYLPGDRRLPAGEFLNIGIDEWVVADAVEAEGMAGKIIRKLDTIFTRQQSGKRGLPVQVISAMVPGIDLWSWSRHHVSRLYEQ
jgi:hypothetical protein